MQFYKWTYCRKFYPQEEGKNTLLYSWLYGAISVFYLYTWACNFKFIYKIIFIMTSNWCRRFWRSSTCHSPDFGPPEILAYMKLSSLSCMAVYSLCDRFSFLLLLSFVTDTTILFPLPPPTLHCAADQTVAGFVGLRAGPSLKCIQQFALICWIQIHREVLGEVREQVLLVDTYSPDGSFSIPVMIGFS